MQISAKQEKYYKKAACVNKFGFASYACMAVLSSLGIYAGIKVKDAIEKPKN